MEITIREIHEYYDYLCEVFNDNPEIFAPYVINNLVGQKDIKAYIEYVKSVYRSINQVANNRIKVKTIENFIISQKINLV